MRSLKVFCVTLFLIFILAQPSHAAGENLYVEESSGYHYLDGEIFRFSQERELTISDYSIYTRDVGTETFDYVNYTYTSADQFGSYKTVSKEMNPSNFAPEVTFWDDGKVKNVNWNIQLFRSPVDTSYYIFDQVADNVFSNSSLGSKRVDLVVDPTVFTLALEHYEFKIVDGELQKLRVNTEMTTDNYEDGLIKRTSFHIIKRTPDAKVVFDYNYSVKETDTFSRAFNLLDQPFLWVPYQLGAIFGLVYLYQRVTRYIREKDIRVVKGTNEETEVDEDAVTNELQE